jgi:hypothetical protein
MTNFRSKASTAFALGLPNIGHAACYRIGVTLGLNPVRRLQADVPQGPFFSAPLLPPVSAPPVAGWETSALLFSHWSVPVSTAPPDWVANPFTGKRVTQPERAWWQIPDFDPEVGDIKVIWELSRMNWVLAFAQKARNGDGEALHRLNVWLVDWCTHNPAYRGPNWKCGQEASIRVMHLAMAAMILGQVRQPMPGLRDLVRLHLQRIAPTVQYAMAQDNNHGTSEAAALFIGGSWLAALGIANGVHWQQTGRKWLENRAARLIGADGSFSQYSLNYHRVLLDTFCMAEVWRRHLGLPAFSALWQRRSLVATQWLRHMVNPVNGDGPNVGANDGARLLPLTDASYRDYRPSVQLATAVFSDQCAYTEDGSWNDSLQWLGLPVPKAKALRPGNLVADDGGFAVLRRGPAMAMLRYPRFKFRPSQADALHLDLWLGGDNLLRDAGSYSYNTEQKWLNYFGGTASHNTVQFDERDQMPRLSRFLFGDWLQTSFLEPLIEDALTMRFGAGYRDRKRASHQRRVSLADSYLRVMDEVAGFRNNAVLRWRLMPGNWHLERCSDSSLRVQRGDPDGLDGRLVPPRGDETHVLAVQANIPIVRCEIVQGWESRHYLEKTPVPVLEVEVQQAGTLTTEYRWAA